MDIISISMERRCCNYLRVCAILTREVIVMRCRNQKMICLFLAFLMLISGMGVKMIKADAFFMASAVKENDSCISSIATFLSGNDSCATELMTVDPGAHIRHIAGRIVQGNKDMKASFHALSPNTISRFFSNIFMAVHAVHFHGLYSRQTILSYIHNTDGKKDSDSYF